MSSTSSDLDLVFHALSDPTRRAILMNLSDADLTISEIAEPFDMSLPGVSKHIRVMERAGLISRRVDGRTHTCRLERSPLMDAREWITFYTRFWNEKLDNLEQYASKEKGDQ